VHRGRFPEEFFSADVYLWWLQLEGTQTHLDK